MGKIKLSKVYKSDIWLNLPRGGYMQTENINVFKSNYIYENF